MNQTLSRTEQRSTPRPNTRAAKGYLVDTLDGTLFIKRVIVPARDRRAFDLTRVWFEVQGGDVHLTLRLAVADARSLHRRAALAIVPRRTKKGDL